jgi:hypothetical protein
VVKKEFGRMPADQLLQLVQLLPESEALSREVRKEFGASPKARAAIAEEPLWWAPLYELPYEQHPALFFKTGGFDHD